MVGLLLIPLIYSYIWQNTGCRGADPCLRECDGAPMECSYTWRVALETTMNLHCGQCPWREADCKRPGCIPGGGVVRPVIAVNSVIPGPPIHVCEGDQVVVKVENRLRTETLSIHWHGLHQVGSFFSDGLPMVSQLPILPTDHFIYNFTASPFGTHMWHGHSSFQEADGLFGQFVVRRKEPKEIRSLYDFDLQEHTIIVWHWFHQSTADVLVPIFQRNGSVSGFGLLVNGKGALSDFTYTDLEINRTKTTTTPREVFTVKKGNRYRFRLIFNSAIYCPVEVSIDQHQLLMIATETGTFHPLPVDRFMVSSGDRFDFVVNASQPGNQSCYLMRFKGHGDCGKTGVHETAYLCYGETDQQQIVALTAQPPNQNQTEPLNTKLTLLNPNEVATKDYSNVNLIHVTELKSTESYETDYSGTPNLTIYTQVHSRIYNSAEFPGAWHQFDNVAYLNPDVSFFENNLNTSSGKFCTDDSVVQHCVKDFCQCTYLKIIPLNSLVEMVLVDITADRDQDHPVHLHGYHFHTVAMGVVGPNITLTDIQMKNEKGFIQKNLKNAITKDTISVPNKGYVILRFRAYNPGFWLFHCHVSNHLELGMAMLLQVGGSEEIYKMCKISKQCGSSFFRNAANSGSNKNSILIIFKYIVIFICFNILF